MTLSQKLKRILNSRKTSDEEKFASMVALQKDVPAPRSPAFTIFVPTDEINTVLGQLEGVRMSAKLCSLWATHLRKVWINAFPDPATEHPIVAD